MEDESKRLVKLGICPMCYKNIAEQEVIASRWYLIKQDDEYVYVIYDLGELIDGQNKKGVIHCSSNIPSDNFLVDELPPNFSWICHECYKQFSDIAKTTAEEEEKEVKEAEEKEVKEAEEKVKIVPLWYDYIEKWSKKSG